MEGFPALVESMNLDEDGIRLTRAGKKRAAREEQRVRQEEDRRRIKRMTDQVKALVSLSICNVLTANRKRELLLSFLFTGKFIVPNEFQVVVNEKSLRVREIPSRSIGSNH